MDARAQASFSELDYRAYGAPVRTSAYVAVRSSAPAYSAPAYSAPSTVTTFRQSSSFFDFVRSAKPNFVTRRAYVQTAPVYQAPVYQTPLQMPASYVEEGPYTLDAGDKLRIVVFGQDALSNTYIVDAEGRVSFPLVGSVNARGLTVTQLAGSLRSQLAQGFIREPSVAVEVEVYRPFFVLGEVTYPGQYPYVPNMTVENAIAIAGGFTPRGFKDKVTVTRKMGGMATRMVLPLRTPARPGDVITVGERWF
jgi:polysaccharide export outer membrane protein